MERLEFVGVLKSELSEERKGNLENFMQFR